MILKDAITMVEKDAQKACLGWFKLTELQQKIIKLYIICGSIKLVSDYLKITYWEVFRLLKDVANDIRFYKQKLPRKYPAQLVMLISELAISGFDESYIIQNTAADAELINLIFGGYSGRIEKDDNLRESHAPILDENSQNMLSHFENWGVRRCEKTKYFEADVYYILLPSGWSVRYLISLGRTVIFDHGGKKRASWNRNDLTEGARIY